MPMLRLAMASIIFLNICCSDKHTPLFKKDMNKPAERKNNLIAFVGRKLHFKRIPTEWDLRNQSPGIPVLFFVGVKATYEITQMIYGDYHLDTITFKAYDHYGFPPFLRPEYALLCLHDDSGRDYRAVRYVHNDIYETTNGRWAGIYEIEYLGSYNAGTRIKPEKIAFKKRVAYPISIICHDGMIRCFERLFPSPYFNIENDSAIAVYGNYIEELFKLKRQDVLSYYGFFEDSIPPPEQSDFKNHPSVILFDGEPDAEQRKAAFTPFGRLFMDSLLAGNFSYIKNLVPDSIKNGDSMLSRNAFMEKNEPRLFNKHFLREVQKGATRFHDKIIESISSRENLMKFYIILKFKQTSEGLRLASYWDHFDPSVNIFDPFQFDKDYYYRDTIANWQKGSN